ncbi:MAG: sugar-binding domain-containing protein [Mariniphaga sp.]
MKALFIYNKTVVLIILLFAFLLSATPASTQVTAGSSVKINDGWKFQKGDVEKAATPEFDDSKWRIIDLPHDWSVEGPLNPNLASATGYLPGGIAWYRKTLNIPSQETTQNVYIYFEGVYRNSEVFINGVSLGMRPNGYISFQYDLTPHLKFGEKNTIAVRVDHSKYADSRWYTGSGIYRDVYLIYKNPVHLGLWGVFCSTKSVSLNQALVETKTTLVNTSARPVHLTVIQEIINNENKTIAKSTGKLSIKMGISAELEQNIKIDKPNLWSIDAPSLYQLVTSVFQEGQLVDKSIENIGLRTLGFDQDKGFSLNGKSMKIKGVCLHHDAGCLGSAVPEEVLERRLIALKSIGCNAIRCSHNPQSPLLYDLCDRLGMLVLDEAFDEWEFPKKKWMQGWNIGTPGFDGPAEFFEKWGEKDLKDMVLRDRNHPSVFMWSIGNEVDYPNDPYSHPILDKEGIGQQHTKGYLPNQPNAERLGTIAKKLAAVVKVNDPTRPVTAGLAGPVMSNETEYPGALDVVGYNYTENRYKQDHATYPKRILYGSENGHSMEAWKAVRDNDYIFGQFLWTGFDYLGESHSWPSRGFTSGLIDLAGFKKPRAYFRESLWSDKPMIYAGTYKKRKYNNQLSIDALPVWNYSAGDTIRIVSYTNCNEVQLLLNGKVIGAKQEYNSETGVNYWDIPFVPGKLEVIGFNSGQEASRYLIETSNRPYAIRANATNKNISSNKGVAQIEIQIVDETGKPVLLADDEITCITDGNIKLLGLEASNPADMEDYKDNRQRVFQGKMIAYLQSSGKKGKSKVTFTSPWLTSAVIEILID